MQSVQKKKKNIEETLRYSPSKDQPSRRLITQRTFARKKEKKRTTPADSQPQEKLRRGTWASALCRVTRVVESFFPSPPSYFPWPHCVPALAPSTRARKRLATSRNERCCAEHGDSLLCGSRCSPFDSSPFLFLDPPHASFDLISIKRVHTFCLARGGGYISSSRYTRNRFPAWRTTTWRWPICECKGEMYTSINFFSILFSCFEKYEMLWSLTL